MVPDIDAVIFDWGGTLTDWLAVDYHAESAALAQAAVSLDGALPPADTVAARLHSAGDAIGARSRTEYRGATIADLFAAAGFGLDPDRLGAYRDFWEPYTATDPQAGPLLETLQSEGIRTGVLSNTIWPRAWHQGFFVRDGVAHLIDAAVYTSEIGWTKPSPRAFAAALAAVGVSDPARCVYVGDRLFEDVWGAKNAGLRAVHLPRGVIPPGQAGHSQGVPDAVVHHLADVADIVLGWHRGRESR